MKYYALKPDKKECSCLTEKEGDMLTTVKIKGICINCNGNGYRDIFIMECIGSCDPINMAEFHFKFRNYCPTCLILLFMQIMFDF